MFKTLREADAVHGGLGKPSKMPGYAYGIPAKHCLVGSKLRKIPGSVCSDCYALKGRYVFKNVQDAQERRFQLLTHPDWVDAMVFTIKRKKIEWFRWHDSGDIQSVDHLHNIARVATACPDTKFWLPTREQKIVLEYKRWNQVPGNLVIRMSGAMIDGSAPIQFFNTSGVVRSKQHSTCPAWTQGGKCGNCRTCWDPAVRNVNYPRH